MRTWLGYKAKQYVLVHSVNGEQGGSRSREATRVRGFNSHTGGQDTSFVGSVQENYPTSSAAAMGNKYKFGKHEQQNKNALISCSDGKRQSFDLKASKHL